MHLPDFLTRDTDGEVRLTDHRIGLYTLVHDYREGWPVERIAAGYPSLPLALVYKVLAFYLENQREIDTYVESYQAELEHQAAAPPGPGVLKVRRLMEARQQAEEP
jgi:uncharacterized protein (DUF433 family)